jgi:hypothetical protein
MGAKAQTIVSLYAVLEAPLFHGTARQSSDSRSFGDRGGLARSLATRSYLLEFDAIFLTMARTSLRSLSLRFVA